MRNQEARPVEKGLHPTQIAWQGMEHRLRRQRVKGSTCAKGGHSGMQPCRVALATQRDGGKIGLQGGVSSIARYVPTAKPVHFVLFSGDNDHDAGRQKGHRKLPQL